MSSTQVSRLQLMPLVGPVARPARYRPGLNCKLPAPLPVYPPLTAPAGVVHCPLSLPTADVWASMGQKDEADYRRQRFQGFQVRRCRQAGSVKPPRQRCLGLLQGACAGKGISRSAGTVAALWSSWLSSDCCIHLLLPPTSALRAPCPAPLPPLPRR